MQRRIKTWLKSTISQKRHNSLSVLNDTDYVNNLSFISAGSTEGCFLCFKLNKKAYLPFM